VLFGEALRGGNLNDWAMVLPIAGANLQKLTMPVSMEEVDAVSWAPDGKVNSVFPKYKGRWEHLVSAA
jgi:hypothetical protein